MTNKEFSMGEFLGKFLVATLTIPLMVLVWLIMYLCRRIYLNKFFFHVSSFVHTLSDCHCKLEWEISANYCVSGELDVPIKTYEISQILFGLMTRQLNFNVLALSSDQIQNCPSGHTNVDSTSDSNVDSTLKNRNDVEI